MVRVLLLIAFLSYPVLASTDAGTRDPLTKSHDVAFENANRISPLVKQRFTLYAAVARCDYTDNQYAFNFALHKFGGSEQWILWKAAHEGWAAGKGTTVSDGPCDEAIDQLRAADDSLLAWAETLPNP